MKWWMIAVLAAGCTKYTRTSMTNAPGNVDLAKPMANENGDPKRFEPPTDPGRKYLVVMAMPMFLFGTGRFEQPNNATFEPGMEFRFERHRSGQDWFAPRFAITAGGGIAQVSQGDTKSIGAFYSELNFRFPTIKGVVPLDIGIGPAVYATDAEVGGQVTLRLTLLAVRARYVARNGFEFWAGYELPIPVIFGRSR